MAALVERHGPPGFDDWPRRSEGVDSSFSALVRAVVFQQLAGAAAGAIFARLLAALGGRATPEAVLGLGLPGLRAAGLSASKANCLLDLAEWVDSGALDLEGLASAPEEEVVVQLCQVRGIGVWTAQMFCMFELRLADVWPVTDYGVRKGYAMAYGRDEPPPPRELEALGEPFRPYRSSAAWYLWRVVEP
jgi:DNA-3-methyladenine glycosylase II